ncbi:(2Fe-2S)-binding protein [Leptospira ryugenii]|uniref:(2Fe-2S)-binding protein n=1 Tax=Leptospira ryugenii TaxID=1917863 RepID=UPI0024949D7D|nr:(2Fe-2S)-binding protein [Leptospira ryugenii]
MRPKRVCLCRMVTERELVDAIHAGANNLELIREKTNASTGCGTCIGLVSRILQRELNDLSKRKTE